MSCKKALSPEDVAKVVGGALTINGVELDMTKTPADYAETYPFIKDAMGAFYSRFENTPLNDICAKLGGEANVQCIIDYYIKNNNITF